MSKFVLVVEDIEKQELDVVISGITKVVTEAWTKAQTSTAAMAMGVDDDGVLETQEVPDAAAEQIFRQETRSLNPHEPCQCPSCTRARRIRKAARDN